jgi:hypothetical protein
LSAIPFDNLLWLVPFLFMLHNMEEAPLMEAWVRRLPIKIKMIESTRQLIIAMIILTFMSFLLTWLGLKHMTEHAGHLLILGMQMTMAFNVFFPHLLSTILFRMYSPGLVTALFLTLPFSIYIFQRALNEKLIAYNELWILLGLSPLIMIVSIFISLKLGKLFSYVGN